MIIRFGYPFSVFSEGERIPGPSLTDRSQDEPIDAKLRRFFSGDLLPGLASKPSLYYDDETGNDDFDHDSVVDDTIIKNEIKLLDTFYFSSFIREYISSSLSFITVIESASPLL
jgi:hypothetical protein